VRHERRSQSPSFVMAANKNSPPRLRTWILRLRRPSAYPLGQRASVAPLQSGPQPETKPRSRRRVELRSCAA